MAGTRAAPLAPVPMAMRGVPPLVTTVTGCEKATVMVTVAPVRRVPEDGEAVTPVTMAGMRVRAFLVVRTKVPRFVVEMTNWPVVSSMTVATAPSNAV